MGCHTAHHPACQPLPRMLQRARLRLSFVLSLFIGVVKAVVVVVQDGGTLPGLLLLALSLCPLFHTKHTPHKHLIFRRIFRTAPCVDMWFSRAGRTRGYLPKKNGNFRIFFGTFGSTSTETDRANARHKRPPFWTKLFTRVIKLDPGALEVLLA